jgi:two-component sensor histidine kinase
MLNRLVALHAWPLPLRIGSSALAVAAAYAFQIPIEREVPGEPFLLFFIAVIACTLAFGELAGFVACGVSTALSFYFFEPVGMVAVHRADDLIKIELYAVMAALSVLGAARFKGALLRLSRAMSNNEKRSAVLLQEMTHRVSNNFSVVAALIRSKAATVNEPSARSVLDEAVEQIVMMARLHRNLYSAGGIAALDSQSFLSELASDLSSTMGKYRQVSITSTVASCPLCLEQAVPLGMIVNELVTNALKHAFPEGGPGSVQILLRKEPGNRLALIIEDDGVGLPEGGLGTGTGQALVAALTEQLGGRVEAKSDKAAGTSFRVTFPYEIRVAGPLLPEDRTVH